MRSGPIALASTLLCVVACAQQSPVADNPLHGAWRVAAMHLILADHDTIEVAAHESLLLFGDGYYSIAYAFGKNRSPIYAERWHPSDREKNQRFGSLIVNTGSYEVRGSRVLARPMFALAPEFVDGEAHFTIRSLGDTLVLRWERSIAFDGLEYPSAGAVTLLHLVRAEG